MILSFDSDNANDGGREDLLLSEVVLRVYKCPGGTKCTSQTGFSFVYLGSYLLVSVNIECFLQSILDSTLQARDIHTVDLLEPILLYFIILIIPLDGFTFYEAEESVTIQIQESLRLESNYDTKLWRLDVRPLLCCVFSMGVCSVLIYNYFNVR